jgi:hypothetical protein
MNQGASNLGELGEHGHSMGRNGLTSSAAPLTICRRAKRTE